MTVCRSVRSTAETLSSPQPVFYSRVLFYGAEFTDSIFAVISESEGQLCLDMCGYKMANSNEIKMN